MLTYSITNQADAATLTASELQPHAHGKAFVLKSQGRQEQVQSRALGNHNVSNLLCVSGILQA
jgi:UDP-N-acetylmuramyl tripeptide synthase